MILSDLRLKEIWPLAAASVVGSLDFFDSLAEQTVERTFASLTRLLAIQQSSLSMFKQRVTGKLKEELEKFFEKTY